MITRLGTYSQIKGASVSLPCDYATTAAIVLTGTPSVDGVTVSVGMRILVKDQVTTSENGIYVVASGAWSRAIDMSLDDDTFQGLQVYVNSGATNGGKTFILTTANPISLGSTSLAFTAASGGGGGIMVAGSGTCSTMRCGVTNTASGNYSFAGGGQFNAANGGHSFIGGGFCNTVLNNGAATCNLAILNATTTSDFCVAGNYTNIFLSGLNTTLSGYSTNTYAISNSVYDSGNSWTVVNIIGSYSGYAATNAAITYNLNSNASTIGAGCCNTICNGNHSFVGGGCFNSAKSSCSNIVGGISNITAAVEKGSIAGGTINLIGTTKAPVDGAWDLNVPLTFSNYYLDFTNNNMCVVGRDKLTNSNVYDVSSYFRVGDCMTMYRPDTDETLTGTITSSSFSGYYTVICGIPLGTDTGGNYGNSFPILNLSNTYGYGGNGSFIGGGINNIAATNSSVVGGRINFATDNSFIGGGCCNISTFLSAIVTGVSNCTSNAASFIGGGVANKITSQSSSISGGTSNLISGDRSFIGGGQVHTISGYDSGILSGYSNTVSGNQSSILSGCTNSILGGSGNTISGQNNTICTASSNNSILGGNGNTVWSYAPTSAIASGCNNKICTNSNSSFIGGGYINCIELVGGLSHYSTISGGYQNTVSATYGFIGGGKYNTLSKCYTTIAGGWGNCVCNTAQYGAILGGYSNIASGFMSAVLGGQQNTASGAYSGAFGCTVTNNIACSFASNQLWACNLVGTTVALCVGTNGVIVRGASDCRLKTNICNIPYGLCEVKQLKPVSFDWNEVERETRGCNRQLGFIAQEVKPIIPEAVGERADNGEMSLSPDKLIPVLTKSVQELNNKLEAQDARIAILEDIIKRNNLI